MKNPTSITDKETSIMLLVMQGFTNEKISQKTGISVNTVKYHLKRIYKKLHVQNRVEAINKFNSINLKIHQQ
jgi:DNA-binding CsgD family transcriptional regulator